MTEFHSERLLALQLCKSRTFSLSPLLMDPSSINRHLLELDALIQTMSFVGKVRVVENLPGAEAYEEEVYAFGQKKRSHQKDSSAVESRGILMAYTRVASFARPNSSNSWIRAATKRAGYLRTFSCRTESLSISRKSMLQISLAL